MGADMLRNFSRGIHSAYATWRRLRRDDSGSVLSLFVVVPVLIGTVALGVETGQMYRVKRQMQGAADAAALSAAVDRMAGKNTATITATALYEAQRNGFQNATNGVAVTVNAPPTSGSNVSTVGAVEVIITKPQSFSLGAALSNMLGVSNQSFNMRSRSVAAQGTYTTTTSSKEGCIVALTTAAEQGVSFTSFNNFNSDCTIISNGTSTSSNANASVYMASFNNATLKSVWTRGSFYKSSYNNFTSTDPVQTNQTSTVVDPYAELPLPPSATIATCHYTDFNVSGVSSVTLVPDRTYCRGLAVSGVSNVYFQPGTYYIAGGDLYLTGVNNVTCPTCATTSSGTTGVTIVLTQNSGNNAHIGGVRISSDNNITLNAPSTGTYKGVLFYQDRNATVGTMTSTSKIFTISSLNTVTLNGAIYFPNNRIDISSVNNVGTGANGCSIWIGRYIKFSSYNNNYRAGCGTYNTEPVSIVTTRTATKGKVYE
jgi:Flp pilus assembly protein TadG